MSTGLKMKYFVLKPAGDGPYAEASRSALQAYARAIREENVDLYSDLENWRIEEQGEANKRRIDRQFEEQESE